jgi:hypothetical protein
LVETRTCSFFLKKVSKQGLATTEGKAKGPCFDKVQYINIGFVDRLLFVYCL